MKKGIGKPDTFFRQFMKIVDFIAKNIVMEIFSPNNRPIYYAK